MLIVFLFHHSYGISSDGFVQRLYDSQTQVLAVLLIVEVDEVAQDLSVGLALEDIATLNELLFQLFVVLDDAIVNQHHLTAH